MRNVTLKQFRLLTAAARGGSFVAAAEACHLTPPAVTMQMRQLEDEAGMALFERQGRSFALTQAGREVLAAAEKIEAVLADLGAGLAAMKSLKSGRVTVGAVSTAKYFVPRMLAAFEKQQPDIDIELVIGNRAETIAAFKDGRFDVAVMGRPPEDVEVESALIGDNPHVIIAPPDHPLAGQKHLPASALAGETVLTRETGSGTRMLAERFFEDAAVSPRIGMEITSNETIKQAVMAGLGIAFISADTIEAEIADGRLAVLDVIGLPIVRQWFVVRPAAKRLMPAARALRDFLTREGRGLLPALKPARPKSNRKE
ncbi:MAG: LysR family transcriptional regulator [Alphaproteobacteria bacterium]|nr:LysR family transcriptional regulator [Alphaproteobacteria bacterium]